MQSALLCAIVLLIGVAVVTALGGKTLRNLGIYVLLIIVAVILAVAYFLAK